MLVTQAYMRLKLMTGMARGGLLRLTLSNLQEEQSHIQRHKRADTTGKPTIYEWTPDCEQPWSSRSLSSQRCRPFLFQSQTSACAARVRLARDLEINAPCMALALELLDEIQRLQAALAL